MRNITNKNICIFIESLKSGGAEKQSLLLAKALKSDHRICLTVLRGEAPEQNFLDLEAFQEFGGFVL